MQQVNTSTLRRSTTLVITDDALKQSEQAHASSTAAHGKSTDAHGKSVAAAKK